MNYDLISELRAIKEKKGLTNKEISDGSGVPLSTVSRIFSNNNNRDVRYETLKPIIRYLGDFDDPIPEEVSVPQPDDSRILSLYKAIIEEKNTLLAGYVKRENRHIRIIITLAVTLAVLFTLFSIVVTIDITHPDRGWWQMVTQSAARVYGRIREWL